jgi:hypothetical protein
MKKISLVLVFGLLSSIYAADYLHLSDVKKRKLSIIYKIQEIAESYEMCITKAQKMESIQLCEATFTQDLYQVRKMIRKFKNDRLRKEAFSK